MRPHENPAIAEAAGEPDITQLDLEADADWLSIIRDDPDPKHPLDQTWIEGMNELIVIGSGRKRSPLYSAFIDNERSMVNGARNEFYKRFGWMDDSHPMHRTIMSLGALPLPHNVVETMRILYRYAADNMMVPLQKRPQFLAMNPQSLLGKIVAVSQGPNDPGILLVVCPHIFTRYSLSRLIAETEKMPDLYMKYVEAVGGTALSRSVAKPEPEPRTVQLRQAYDASPDDRKAAVARLGELTGWEVDEVITVSPELLTCDSGVLAQVIGAAQESSDAGEDLLTLREVSKLVRNVSQDQPE